MSWKKRPSGKRYYYRSQRVGAHVTTLYLGHGPDADEAAHQDATRARQRQERRERAFAEANDPAEQAARDVERRVRAVLNDVLTAAGFRQHQRGTWRKSRGG